MNLFKFKNKKFKKLKKKLKIFFFTKKKKKKIGLNLCNIPSKLHREEINGRNSSNQINLDMIRLQTHTHTYTGPPYIIFIYTSICHYVHYRVTSYPE